MVARSLIILSTASTLLLMALSIPVVAGTQLELLHSDFYDGRDQASGNILTIRRFDAWHYGDSYFFADISALDDYAESGSVYMEWAPRLSLGKTFRDKPLKVGAIKDIYLIAEIDHLHARFDTNAIHLAGLSVDLDVPGFLFFKVHFQNRDDHALPGHTQQLTLAWKRPFTIAGETFSFEGFADFAGSEGGREANILSQPQLIWKVTDHFFAGIEYQYWRHKFGISGLNESAPQLLIRWNW